MPTTNLLPKQILRMDGNNGAHIANLPGAAAGLTGGDSIHLGTKGLIPVDLTVNAAAGDSIELPDGTTASSFNLTLVREFVEIRYDLSNQTWFAVARADEQPVTAYDAGATGTISGASSTIQVPLTFRGGDNTIFSVAGNVITANYGFIGQLVEVKAELICNVATYGNNQAINAAAFARLVAGSGAFEGFGDAASTGFTSRAWAVPDKLSVEAFWTPNAGDQIDFYLEVLDQDAGPPTAEILDGYVTLTVVPV